MLLSLSASAFAADGKDSYTPIKPTPAEPLEG